MNELVRSRVGKLSDLPHILTKYQCDHVFLVTGRRSFEESGAKEALRQHLQHLEVTRFSDVGENPSIEQLDLGLKRFRDCGAQMILSVGGGSVMDMAKLIKMFSGQDGPVKAYLEGSANLKGVDLPHIAIPTTAGSGSQATHFAVLYVGKTKHSVAHPSMLPDDTVLDSSLLRSLPSGIAASAGLDALNQGIESYWSIHSTDLSKKYAKKAIQLVWQNLLASVINKSSMNLSAMAKGAHLAGEAINITKTTAPHAISYPITSFFGVPHGHAVGLVLPSIFVFNQSVSNEDCLDARGAEYVRGNLHEICTLLGENSPTDAAEAYNLLMDRLDLSRNFQELGLGTPESLDIVVSNGFNPERVNNNPRKLTESALREILNELQSRSSTENS